MIKAYLIAKWSVYILFLGPLVSSILIPILINNLGLSPKIGYVILVLIAVVIAIVLPKNKYSHIDVEILNATKRFENGIGLIFFGHFLLAVGFMLMTWQPVLAFFALPVALLIIFSYMKGLVMTSEELETYNQAV